MKEKVKTLSEKVIKQLQNSWVSIKRSEYLHQMMPFFSDGLSIKIQFQGSLKEAIIRGTEVLM